MLAKDQAILGNQIEANVTMTKEMIGLGNILIIAKSYLSGSEFAASEDVWSIYVFVVDRCVKEPIQWGDAPSLPDFEYI